MWLTGNENRRVLNGKGGDRSDIAAAHRSDVVIEPPQIVIYIFSQEKPNVICAIFESEDSKNYAEKYQYIIVTNEKQAYPIANQRYAK